MTETTEPFDFSCLFYDELQHQNQNQNQYQHQNETSLPHQNLASNYINSDPNIHSTNATNSKIMVAPSNSRNSRRSSSSSSSCNNNGLIVPQGNINVTNSNTNCNGKKNGNGNVNGNNNNNNGISNTSTSTRTKIVEEYNSSGSDEDSDSSSKHLDLFLLKEKVNGSILSTFKIYPVEATYDRLRDWIELSGGFVMEATQDSPYAIPILDLAYCKMHNVTSFQKLDHRDLFKSLFIYDCYTKEQVQDLNLYRTSESTLVEYDANLILRRQLSWDEVFTACTSTVFQNDDSEEEDEQCEQNINGREVEQEKDQVQTNSNNNDNDNEEDEYYEGDEDEEEEEEEEEEEAATTDESEKEGEEEEEEQDPLAIPSSIQDQSTNTGSMEIINRSQSNAQNLQNLQKQNSGRVSHQSVTLAGQTTTTTTTAVEHSGKPPPPIKRTVHDIEFENDAIRRRRIPAFISPKRQPATASSSSSTLPSSSSHANTHAHANSNGTSSRTGSPSCSSSQRIPTSSNREIQNSHPPPSSTANNRQIGNSKNKNKNNNTPVRQRGNSSNSNGSNSKATVQQQQQQQQPRVIVRRRRRRTPIEGESPNPKSRRKPKNQTVNPIEEQPGTSTTTTTATIATPGKKVIRIRRVRKPKPKATANVPPTSSPTSILPDGISSSPRSQVPNTVYNESVLPDQHDDDEPGKLVIDTTARKRRHVAYVWQDSRTLLNYVCQHNLHGEVRGNRIWHDIAKMQVIPNRTWLSLKEHFRRKILENLVHFQCNPDDLKKFSMLKKRTRVSKPKSPKSPKQPKSPKRPSPAKRQTSKTQIRVPTPTPTPTPIPTPTPASTPATEQDIYITADLPSSPELSPKEYTEFRTCTVSLNDVHRLN